MIRNWRRVFPWVDHRGVYCECRRCGTTVEVAADECPGCGSTRIARYELP
jgi:rubrerythrin